jgi:2-polyprenyl-6-methoxyphenol hydroxylase-like FAD-dependent oxidoreductase
MATPTITVRCCIAGGGPAGMMLGLLLARAGIEVLVLEKHADFLRDFRGDTIHPSTLEIMHELGLVDALLRLPHEKVSELDALIGDTALRVADFSHLPTHCRFIAIMPQWDFLNFLAEQARRYAGFALRMHADVTGLIEQGGRVSGVRVTTPDGPLDVRADLVIGADGRHSVVRAQAGLTVEELGAPMDVAWFRLSRHPGDPGSTRGRFDNGVIFVMINRGEHWQCGYVIAKGSIERLRARGLEPFRAEVARLSGFGLDRVAELADWDAVKLLTVRVDRLPRWYRPGLLCIGDAAHAMSPIGGVGINLAIQDAVATANLLAAPLAAGAPSPDDLERVQRRRMLATRVIQGLQIVAQNRILARVIGRAGATDVMRPPRLVIAFNRLPMLRRIPGRLLGLGIRPEHVRSPAVATVR